MIAMRTAGQDQDEPGGLSPGSEAMLNGIRQQCPIPQLIVDKSHRVVFWNRALEEYSGISAKSILGTQDQWRAFYDHPRPVLADLLVEGAIEDIPRWYGGKFRKSRLIEEAYEATDFFPHLGRGGTWLYFTAAPIRDRAGQIVGAIETLEDVTERQQAERALQDARDEAELYLDLMGHDIKNFDQVGMGYLEIALERLKLSEAEREMIAKPLEMMRESIRLIANVKKLRMARSGAMKLETVDLGQVLSRVVARCREVPGRDVAIDYHPGPAGQVPANALLDDVFDNIVGNAVKHSEGPLRITISVERTEEAGKGYYRITIDDTGPGIPDRLKPGLFTRFRRGETTKIDKGLGLYLVKTLVEGYCGHIEVADRVPGDYRKGARFIVTLPAAG